MEQAMKFKKEAFKKFKKSKSISFNEINSKKSISYHYILPKDLSESSLRRLRSLTLANGAMKGQLGRCVSGADAGVVLTAEHKKHGIIGWALLFEDYFNKIPIYFYVHATFRRKGIGTNLLTLGTKIIRNKLKSKEDVFPHDTRSTRFFDKVYFKKSK
jgi:GNAT superfamily N-acetyltransferase